MSERPKRQAPWSLEGEGGVVRLVHAEIPRERCGLLISAHTPTERLVLSRLVDLLNASAGVCQRDLDWWAETAAVPELRKHHGV